MVRRATSAASPDAPDITNAQPEDMPGVPAGVDADVQVRYRARVSPREGANELNDLALEHADAEAPVDPFVEFLETWNQYAGYSCMVVRLPDSSTRRAPGSTYNRPHFGQPETLGAITFDPNPINMIGALQVANGNSGGSFQLQLLDYNGTRVPGGILYSYTIGDPARTDRGRTTEDRQDQRLIVTPQSPPQKSDSERKLEEAKDSLFNKALDRALNPAPSAPASGNGLSSEDNAKLFILGQPGMLDGIFGSMATLAQKAASASEPSAPTLKDRALDAAVQIVTTNPAIVDRLSGVTERIFARLLPDPRYDAPLPPPPGYYPQSQPVYAPQPQPAPVSASGPDLPEAPDQDDGLGEDDQDTVDILDDLLTLLNSNDPLTLNPPPPVIAQLIKDYPIKARVALRMIAAQPLDDIIEWIKDTGGKPYVSLLDGASGPFLRGRLAEFKRECESQQQKVKTKEAAPAPAPETETPTA